MKTFLECIPCFFKQMLTASRLAGCDEVTQKKIIDDVARRIPSLDLHCSPPQTARVFYDVIIAYTGNRDIYAPQKKQSNEIARALYPHLTQLVDAADEPLHEAAQLAVIGNILDFGVNGVQTVEELETTLHRLLDNRFSEDTPNFLFTAFDAAISRSRTLLYLADNAGEIVFDRVLIETIHRIYPGKDIYLAVRSAPIINDVCVEDARECGLDSCATVIESGSACPGTILPSPDRRFMDIYAHADCVISKGQGNFETLSDVDKDIFYLFLTKCDVVAGQVGVPINSIMLRRA